MAAPILDMPYWMHNRGDSSIEWILHNCTRAMLGICLNDRRSGGSMTNSISSKTDAQPTDLRFRNDKQLRRVAE